MKNIKFSLLVVLQILAGQKDAQQGFYLKPLIQVKWVWNRDPINYTLLTTPNQPIQIISEHNYRPKGFDIGLILGYNFRKAGIEIGLCQDGTNSGYTVRGMSHGTTDSAFSIDYFKHTAGLLLTKIPVRFQYRLFKIDSIHHDPRHFSLEVWGFAGLDFLFKPRGDPSSPYTMGGTEFYQGAGKYIEVSDKLYETREHKGRLRTLGLTLKLFKRDRNLLDISFYSSWGAINFSNMELTITNTDGRQYRHNEYSDASGYYISFSTELNLRKIRKRYF
jgi:hypothetical protein